MKNNRYSISIRHALMLLVLLLGFPYFGYAEYDIWEDVDEDGLHYQINVTQGYAECYGYGVSGNIVIPSSIFYKTRNKYYPVTQIGRFQGDSITSITIPESVTTICSSAFWGCSGLTSIEIPNSVTTIGSSAFYDCRGLTSIKIPNGVASIGDDAFYGCSGLTSINIPESVTSIGSNAFQSCSGLTSINIPDSVNSIGSDAFWNCSGLTSITIPSSVTSIGKRAFYYCTGLISLNIPNRFIDSDIIQCSKLESLTVYGDVPSYCCDIIGLNSSLKSVTIEDATSIGSFAFMSCNGLTSINIPEGVESIGWSAFCNCSGLTSINIPEGVELIGSGAFEGCSGLTSINIPEGVKLIDSGTFKGCSGLTSINIPESVTRISSEAFAYSGLTSIEIPNSVTLIGSYAFSNCSALTSINIPESVTSIGSYAFSNCSALTSINISEGVTSIGSDVFNGCSSLLSLTIPKSVTSIGEAAFKDCSSLSKAMIIPSNVTEIADETFMGCSSLPLVRLTSNVAKIGNHAFDGCKAFKSFTFAPNITSIGNSAFRNCGGLTSIKLPSKVDRLGNYAFADCENLESAIFNSNVEINNTTFENDTKLKTLTSDVCYFDGVALYNKEKTKLIGVFDYTLSECTGIPETVISIGEHAFKDCTNLSKINLPSGLTSVGYDAFCNCEKMTLSALPDQLTSIGERAFLNCSNITIKRSPSTLKYIGGQAFANCKGITSFTFANDAYLGTGVFTDCTSLKTVNISWLKDVSDCLFENCAALNRVVTSADLTSVGTKAFKNCSNLASITLSSVRLIKSEAFYGCSNLKEVSMLKVDSLCSEAFYGCSNLEEINIPNIIYLCQDNIFNGCSNLKKANIPNVKSLGNNTFYGCSNLEAINIPNIKSLGSNTFNGCSALKKANILSCDSISDSVFKDCVALQSIQIQSDSLRSIGRAAFSGCLSLTSPWEFLNSDMTIADSAFIGCTSLKKIRVRRNDPYSNCPFAENLVVYVPEGSKETYQNVLPQCTIYEDCNKNSQESQAVLSLCNSYNQIDFKPLVDEEADAPWTECNVLTDVSQLSANFVNELEGSLDALVDSSDDSYFLSAWDADNPNEDYHYIQADLKKGCKAFNITFKRRSTDDNSAPTKVHVFVTNTLGDDNNWIDLGRDTLIYNDLTASINANYYAKVRYVRLQVEATADNTKEYGNLFFALNKLDITPCRLNTSIPKWDDGIYYAITDAENYDKKFLSGEDAQLYNRCTVFKVQYTLPLKYVVMKYVKGDKYPMHKMNLDNCSEGPNYETFTINADYRYYNNTTGIYCAQFQQPTYEIELWSPQYANVQCCAHVYTRPPKANLISEDARTAIKDLLSLYDDKDFIQESDLKILQNYCNEITRLAQSGRYADFAKHEYCTFYADYPAVVPMLVKAGIVKEQNGELVVDYIYNEGDVIPANTGVILKGNCLGNAYVMEQGTTDATSPEGNLLHGTVDDEETYVDGCSRYYMLSYDKAGDSRLGFYWNGENGPHPFINKAYKAYLAIPDTYNAMGKDSFSLAEMEENHGEITHISSVRDDKNHMQSGIYSIDGRKIDATNIKQLPAGVYIVNGKKVIVK